MRRIILPLLLIAITLFAAIPFNSSTAVQVSHAPRVPIGKSTSGNWSGYAAETNLTTPQSGVVTDVKGQWTVPSVSGSGYSAIWVGIDGYSNGTVEQIGTEQDYINGRAYYSAWWEMFPDGSQTIQYTVQPGDVMTAEVSYTSGSFLLTLNDTTAGWKFTKTVTSTAAQLTSAEWIVEAPSMATPKGYKVLPLANFGTVSISGAKATIAGTPGPISSWPYDPMTMIDGGAKAIPSTPPTSTGTSSSFTVSYSKGNSSKGPR